MFSFFSPHYRRQYQQLTAFGQSGYTVHHLLYRLLVLPIRMPPLSERREDIALLANHFCVEVCQKHALPSLSLSMETLCAVEAAEWSGNVRELSHAIEAAAIRAAAEGAQQIERWHLFPQMEAPSPRENSPARVQPLDLETYKQMSFQEATQRFQAQLLHAVLQDTGWNVAEAATRLSLAKSYVYKLIHALGLSRNREGAGSNR